MTREERERRQLLRHWARFMIMHLEGRDTDPPLYGLDEALERLRELIDEELSVLRRERDDPDGAIVEAGSPERYGEGDPR